MYTLNNELENLLTNVVNQAQQAGKVMLDSVPVDPNMLNQFQSTMPQVKEQMKAAGKPCAAGAAAAASFAGALCKVVCAGSACAVV
ncbi:hypothetical protein ECZU17_30750 [Escherichia coli]|nr:hypothetical protein ECZU17_30750 [Escherichia coli]